MTTTLEYANSAINSMQSKIDALQAERDGLKDYARAAESLYEKAIAERDAQAAEIARLREALIACLECELSVSEKTVIKQAREALEQTK